MKNAVKRRECHKFWYEKKLLDFAEDKLREEWQENQKKDK